MLGVPVRLDALEASWSLYLPVNDEFEGLLALMLHLHAHSNGSGQPHPGCLEACFFGTVNEFLKAFLLSCCNCMHTATGEGNVFHAA